MAQCRHFKKLRWLRGGGCALRIKPTACRGIVEECWFPDELKAYKAYLAEQKKK